MHDMEILFAFLAFTTVVGFCAIGLWLLIQLLVFITDPFRNWIENITAGFRK